MVTDDVMSAFPISLFTQLIMRIFYFQDKPAFYPQAHLPVRSNTHHAPKPNLQLAPLAQTQG
jgi:hypothetical protein